MTTPAPVPAPLSPEQHLKAASAMLQRGMTAPAETEVAMASIALAHATTGILALLLRTEGQS